MWTDEMERRAAEMRQRNERRQLVSRLGEEHLRIAEETARTGAAEYHHTVKELGGMWRLSTATITRMFRDEPGVLKIGEARGRRGRRSYTTLRIPESVVQRVYRRLVVR
jgi:hypothetical protein